MQLTTHSFVRAVSYILRLRKGPVLLLGGGGYHPPSTAKHFALLTASVLERELDDDIPLDAEYWEELEKDGGINIGKDSVLNSDEERKVDELCTALKQKLERY